MTLLRQILCALSVFLLNTGTEVFAQTEYDPDASQIANLNELDYGSVRTGAAGIVFPTVQLDFTVPEAPVAEVTVIGYYTDTNDDGEAVTMLIYMDTMYGELREMDSVFFDTDKTYVITDNK